MTPFENEVDELLSEAEALLQEEKPVEALNILDRAWTLSPNHSWTMLFRGVALGQLGRLEEAIDQLLAAADGSPSDIDVQVDSARYLTMLEQHQDALVCANRAVALDDMDAGAHAVHAEVLERLGRIAEAIPSREHALLLDAEDMDSRYYLAVDLCDLARYDEAFALADALYAEFPDDEDIVRLHGACLSYLGRHEAALSRWAELERVEGVTPNLLHNRASTLDALGLFDEALATLNDAIDLEPAMAANYFTRAMIHEHRDDYTAAIDDYLSALAFDADHLDAVINLVEVAPLVDATSSVLERINLLLKADANSAKLHYARGRLLMELDELLEGKLAIEDALGREPALGVAWYTLSMLNGLQGEYADAVSAADRALLDFPDDYGLWLNKGQSYHEMHQHREALDSYDRATTLAPDDWLAWMHMGRLFLLDLERPADARGVLQEALRLSPGNEHIVWLLSLCLLRLGRNDEAERHLTHLLQEFPNHLWGHLVRAALSAQRGQLDEAFADLAIVTKQRYDLRLLVNEPLFAPLWPDPRFAETVGQGDTD